MPRSAPKGSGKAWWIVDFCGMKMKTICALTGTGWTASPESQRTRNTDPTATHQQLTSLPTARINCPHRFAAEALRLQLMTKTCRHEHGFAYTQDFSCPSCQQPRKIPVTTRLSCQPTKIVALPGGPQAHWIQAITLANFFACATFWRMLLFGRAQDTKKKRVFFLDALCARDLRLNVCVCVQQCVCVCALMCVPSITADLC